MPKFDRRQFLKIMGAGSAAASVPLSIQRALAIPAHNRHRSIEDVEHIVILTQENRSFDHYFGMMRGVRGFADPRAVNLPSGLPVWYQPTATGHLLPFRPDVEDMGTTYLPDVSHGWNDSHGAWNDGNYDQWVPNKGVTTMTYHTPQDLPYHYALADAFTVCDAYYCSLMGPTDPNRYHLWSGYCGNDGAGGGPVIANTEAGYSWTTYPERLQQAGIRWKIYQDIGNGLDAAGYWGWVPDPYIGNYGDNSLLYFTQYQNAQPGNPLADFAKTGTDIVAENRDITKLFNIFRQDVSSGNLPQVSWITAPEAFTEHPNFHGAYGAWYISQILDILTSNPEVWSKTALFVHYDEGGGFFDHMVPPSPAGSSYQGASTVDTSSEIYPGDTKNISAPYGLGTRVPMMVISPWSKGGYVNSQVFDHTSLIQFIETRFSKDYPGIIETNITPWRRAVTGDLTSAFDFHSPNSARPRLPSTVSDKPADLVRHPSITVVPPVDQSMPIQEKGIRHARALPYLLLCDGKMNDDGSFQIDFRNKGEAAAVFQVRRANGVETPRTYTVEAGKQLSDSWDVAGGYDLSVYGPNGFFRSFKGGDDSQQALLDVKTKYADDKRIVIHIKNHSRHAVKINIVDQYTGKRYDDEINSYASISKSWSLKDSHGWYDLLITVAEDSDLAYQVAGHLEDGKDSISDPGMGGLV